MSESTDFRAWLDRSEREAHDAIARSYAEGRAALGVQDAADQAPHRDSAAAATVPAAEKAEPTEQDGDTEQA